MRGYIVAQTKRRLHRRDVLDEIDGPMLRHGLQERHGERLRVLPTSRRERPASDLLEQRFERFRTAADEPSATPRITECCYSSLP